jgi:hypothetical protein
MIDASLYAVFQGPSAEYGETRVLGEQGSQ